MPAASVRLPAEDGAKSVFKPKPMTPDYVATGHRSGCCSGLRRVPSPIRRTSRRRSNFVVTAQAGRIWRVEAMPVVAFHRRQRRHRDSADSIHSASIARQSAVQNGRFVLLPGVGHMPHHAAPEIVDRGDRPAGRARARDWRATDAALAGRAQAWSTCSFATHCAMRTILVAPGVPKGTPATTMMRSPVCGEASSRTREFAGPRTPCRRYRRRPWLDHRMDAPDQRQSCRAVLRFVA